MNAPYDHKPTSVPTGHQCKDRLVNIIGWMLELAFNTVLLAAWFLVLLIVLEYTGVGKTLFCG